MWVLVQGGGRRRRLRWAHLLQHALAVAPASVAAWAGVSGEWGQLGAELGRSCQLCQPPSTHRRPPPTFRRGAERPHIAVAAQLAGGAAGVGAVLRVFVARQQHLACGRRGGAGHGQWRRRERRQQEEAVLQVGRSSSSAPSKLRRAAALHCLQADEQGARIWASSAQDGQGPPAPRDPPAAAPPVAEAHQHNIYGSRALEQHSQQKHDDARCTGHPIVACGGSAAGRRWAAGWGGCCGGECWAASGGHGSQASGC